jgi:hypothetical protein
VLLVVTVTGKSEAGTSKVGIGLILKESVVVVVVDLVGNVFSEITFEIVLLEIVGITLAEDFLILL